MCVCVQVCLPVSLLPHTQAFLTQEDLDMSLSVSTKTLWIFLIMSLSMLVGLRCVVVWTGGITLEAGRWLSTGMPSTKVLASHLSVSVRIATVT